MSKKRDQDDSQVSTFVAQVKKQVGKRALGLSRVGRGAYRIQGNSGA